MLVKSSFIGTRVAWVQIRDFLELIALSKLRVMLVDECQERQQAIGAQLTSADCDLVANLAPEADILQQVMVHKPDVVIIDMDSPSRDTLESLRMVQQSMPRPMVMFSQDDNGETIREAVAAGVSAYVVDGIRAKRVRPIIDAALALFQQFRALETELGKTRTQLAERKLIERAKGIVMAQCGLSESDAYRLMRKNAMEQNKRMVNIAQSIISAADLLGGQRQQRN